MEDAGGIVHHTIRINHRTELLLLESASDTIGKTGAYEEHLLARTDPKTRILNINDRPKIHFPLLASTNLQTFGREFHLYEACILIQAVF